MDNQGYEKNRFAALETLRNLIARGRIDPPLVELHELFSRVPHGYTIQSCFGHFVHEWEPDEDTTASLAPYNGMVQTVFYRIAIIAFVLEKSKKESMLCHDNRTLTVKCPEYIQFGSAGWFWVLSVKSCQIQVAPEQEKQIDCFWVTYKEALLLENFRDVLIRELAATTGIHIRLTGN